MEIIMQVVAILVEIDLRIPQASLSAGLTSLSDALILGHEPTRLHMRGLPEYQQPSLEELRDMALTLARVSNPGCQVVGISVNTQHLGSDEAITYLAEVEERMGLPTVDPIRIGAGRLVEALETI